MANMGIMHWKLAPGRVACNAKNAIMGVPFDEFLTDVKPCKRCQKKAQFALEYERKKKAEAAL